MIPTYHSVSILGKSLYLVRPANVPLTIMQIARGYDSSGSAHYNHITLFHQYL